MTVHDARHPTNSHHETSEQELRSPYLMVLLVFGLPLALILLCQVLDIPGLLNP